jgi:hypothetical protein
LAVFWNVYQIPPEVGDAFAVGYQRLAPDLPFYHRIMPGLDGYLGFFTAAAEGIRRAGAFGEPEQWRLDWYRPYTRDEWLDQVPTFGGHNHLPSATLAELLAHIGDAIDAVGGSFTMRYIAMTVTAERTAPAEGFNTGSASRQNV